MDHSLREGGLSAGDRLNGCHLTTPHKLQAEASVHNPARAGQVVSPGENRWPQACQLHAVVRPCTAERGVTARVDVSQPF